MSVRKAAKHCSGVGFGIQSHASCAKDKRTDPSTPPPSPTFSELVLFPAVRGKRLGVALKRQVVVDRYIVDPLAPAVKLIVGADGGYHSRSRFRAADARRDRRLQI